MSQEASNAVNAIDKACHVAVPHFKGASCKFTVLWFTCLSSLTWGRVGKGLTNVKIFADYC